MPLPSLSTGLLLSILLAGAGLVGCAPQPPMPDAGGSSQAPPARDTLYAELGGMTALEAVVEDFLYRVADDDRIVGFFANTNIDHFATAFATQLCDIGDGPCDYAGPSMARAHQQMGLTEAHFNAVVEHLRAALVAEGVAAGPRNRLLGRLARLQDAVMLRQP